MTPPIAYPATKVFFLLGIAFQQRIAAGRQKAITK
jgi:hypothetical protein